MKKITIDTAKKTVSITPGTVKPALCLDLDGTVRYSLSGDFINSPDDIALFPEAEAKIWQYRKEGYLIIGVTNQGGVAYGYKTPQDNDAEIDKMCSLFEKNPFHIIESCLHHPKGSHEPYNHRSLCRKPDIGMLVLAEAEAWEEAGVIVDWDRSLLVGDRPEDMECAERAGIEFRWAWEFFGREKPN